MKRVVRWSLVVVLGLLQAACFLTRASLEESREELTSLLEPAFRAGFDESVGVALEATHGCHDPFYGPREHGLSIHVFYRVPYAEVRDHAEFLDRVSRAWQEIGLEISPDYNTEGLDTLFSGRDGYSLQAFLNDQTQEAYIGGSGPCVDNPDAY